MWTIASIWRENMLRYLPADIVFFGKRTVLKERGSRKTVSFEEQIINVQGQISYHTFAPN